MPFALSFTVHVLWWYENADGRAAGRHEAHEDARVVAAGKRKWYLLACIAKCHNVTQRIDCSLSFLLSVRESVQFLESQRNMLLIPTPFSPLK